MLAHRDLMAGTKSADIDVEGLDAALTKIVKSCGSLFCVRLNDRERKLIDRLMALDAAGREIKTVTRPQLANPLQALLQRGNVETARKIASIKADREREEAINNEANYTSRKDMEAADKKASVIQGDVAAKKLDASNETPSLADLMGNNRFIEESMKHSHIATSMASEEGWDMAKMNAPKATDAQDKSVKSAKSPRKTSRRKKENVQ